MAFDGVLSTDELDAFAPFLEDVYDACRVQGIPADAAISENGCGQFEINLLHVADPLRAADDALLFKRLVKAIARKHGLAASFMAKTYGDQSGNGFHVHFSLIDDDGRNVFDDGGDEGSEHLRHAVGGLISAMAETTLLFAPHLNSYRRLRKGTHAPVAMAWGYENRTAAVRIPGGAAAARRIEHRVAGADANPYLVMAGILGAALIGIERELIPPDPTEGDAYAQDLPTLPPDWASATVGVRGWGFGPGDLEPCPAQPDQRLQAAGNGALRRPCHRVRIPHLHGGDLMAGSYAGDGAYPESYYAASANPAPDRPALSGQAEIDIAVVGAGYTGLSAALHLAEQGHKVAIVEGAQGRLGCLWAEWRADRQRPERQPRHHREALWR